jgi:hypothetical protein
VRRKFGTKVRCNNFSLKNRSEKALSSCTQLSQQSPHSTHTHKTFFKNKHKDRFCKKHPPQKQGATNSVYSFKMNLSIIPVQSHACLYRKLRQASQNTRIRHSTSTVCASFGRAPEILLKLKKYLLLLPFTL